MSTNGKGSKTRPLSVPYSKYADNFDGINWSKKQFKKEVHMTATEHLPEDYNTDKQSNSLINPNTNKN
jgi:hypothetical protein